MKDINNIAESGKLFDGRYKLLRPLSSDGGTADVWLALDTNKVFDDESDNITALEETGIKVAIKIYRPKNALDFGEQRFREEFKIVFNCHHTNLVQPINFSIFEGVPYLVLPYCKNGSSESLQGKISDKDELWRYISDVSAGLTYLHSFNPTIVHHDIKPANILIDDSKNFAITDFGISSYRGLNREGDESQSGTMAYMAPERFKDDYESTPESDIWSFGATLYELITGKVPFGEDGGVVQLDKKLPPPVISQNIPSDVKTLIYDCLSFDPSKRPTATDINKAAQTGHYPVRSTKRYIILAGTVIVSIIALFLAFWPQPQSVKSIPKTEHLSNEEVFNNAMFLVDSSDATKIKEGLSILDSLSSLGYVPAIYEEAVTYGWYDDERSVTRKKLLGIKTQSFLPISYHVNNKAIAYLTRIEEISDPKYPELNAQALYKLAVYYFNDNKMFKKDVDRAERLSVLALEWAKKSGNNALVQKITRNLQIIKDSKK